MNDYLVFLSQNLHRVTDLNPGFFLTQFLATTLAIYLRGVQTQNVVHGNYLGASITTIGMSVTNVVFIGLIATDPWASLIPATLGGMVGVNGAMYYKRHIRIQSDNKRNDHVTR